MVEAALIPACLLRQTPEVGEAEQASRDPAEAVLRRLEGLVVLACAFAHGGNSSRPLAAALPLANRGGTP